jgi:predicted RNA-binding Zn ribbon-like protein
MGPIDRCAAVDFLNTRHMGRSGVVDELTSFDAVVSWARTHELLGAADLPSRNAAHSAALRHFALVIAMRSAFEAFLLTKTAETRRALVGYLNAALASARSTETVITADAAAFDLSRAYDKRDSANVPHAIAWTIVDCLRSVPLGAVRRCSADDCILFFLDVTKNGSRRWCSGAGCGARVRARRHYASRKMSSPSGVPGDVA